MSADEVTALERIVLAQVLEELGGPLTPDAHRAALIATHHLTGVLLDLSETNQRLERRCYELRQFIA